MGKLQIIDHDGHGNLRFDERPFVIMQDGAFVDLGQVGATAVDTRAVVRPVAPRQVRDVGEAPQRRTARAEVDLGRENLALRASSSARSWKKSPALGPPLHFPSDSAGFFSQR